MMRSNPANASQKTYDDCYLMCSTAIYFEKQNNEEEALRSWREALDQIYYHNAYKIPANYRPKSETEKALLQSLRDMELQCKERVDLLEALKQSRIEDKQLGQTSTANSSSSHLSTRHGSAGSASSQRPLGEGTVVAQDYSNLARPALPQRPSPARPAYPTSPRPRDPPPYPTTSARSYQNYNPPASSSASSTLAPPPSQSSATSRSSSPEKKARTLKTTLRPGAKDNPKHSSKFASSLRPKPPAAAQAATLAWPAGYTPPQAANGSSVSLNTLLEPRKNSEPFNDPPPYDRKGSTNSMRPPSPQPPHLTPIRTNSGDAPRPRPNSFSGNSNQSTPTDYYAPPPIGDPPKRRTPQPPQQAQAPPPKTQVKKEAKPPPPPVAPKPKAKAPEKKPELQANLPPIPDFPAYRKEYNDTTASVDDQKAQQMAALYHGSRERNIKKAEEAANSSTPPRSKPVVSRKAIPKDSSGVRPGPAPRTTDSSSSEVDQAQRKKKLRKPRDETDSSQPNSPDEDRAVEGIDPEVSAMDARIKEVMTNLPRGVDEQAAKSIFNEIVITGDEVHWDDVAGLDVAKNALKEAVVYPFLRPDLFMGLREPARGMLLFGPPGTGKTMLARAVATESKSTFFAISASSLTSKFLGESEKLVRALFSLAKVLAPSIIFVDEIDSLLSSRSGSGEHEATRRIKTEFLIQWSDLQKAAAGRDPMDKGDATRVLVLAATNLPWAIDEAARRRFVRRQYIPLPEDHVRADQLRRLMAAQNHGLGEDDFQRLVQLTDGFSGSDITALAKDAAMGPLRSLGEALLHMASHDIRPISIEDFEASLVNIRPSVSKQGLQEFEDWAREFGERGG